MFIIISIIVILSLILRIDADVRNKTGSISHEIMFWTCEHFWVLHSLWFLCEAQFWIHITWLWLIMSLMTSDSMRQNQNSLVTQLWWLFSRENLLQFVRISQFNFHLYHIKCSRSRTIGQSVCPDRGTRSVWSGLIEFSRTTHPTKITRHCTSSDTQKWQLQVWRWSNERLTWEVTDTHTYPQADKDAMMSLFYR